MTPHAPATEATDPTLLITEPEVLGALEGKGADLGSLLGAPQQVVDNAELSALPSFAPVVQLLEAELRASASRDPLAGVDIARSSHRLFDRRFLRAKTARFQLIGVVNRPDRAAFDPSSCGETRLVFRLRYDRGGDRTSQLPMTLGLELEVPREAGSCREAAARWLEPRASDPVARANWLRSEVGPLSRRRLRLTRGSRLVLNLQLVRWPAGVRPDLGGHAEYLLRAFSPDAAGVLRPEGLENTIDPDDFRKPELRHQLSSALLAQPAAIDSGTLLLPDGFLARRSLSVTPRGLARLANRPFSAALRVKDLEHFDFSGRKRVQSALGVLRRLDQLSCPGCHQARSVAGFHLLGEGLAQDPLENALALPVSPHVLEDLPRRRQVAQQMLAGEPPELASPFAERPSPSPGRYGTHCSLDRDPTFSAWKCAAPLTCSAIEANVEDPVGQCLPPQHQVGDACENGGISASRDPLRDHMQRVRVEPCPGMICNRSAVGFPAGMCTAGCGAAGSRCGPIAVLDSFNACLARGEAFLGCIRANVRPAGLRGCDAEHPCRDDYVCARSEQGGVCLPPYFVFQLRVDGHGGP